MKDREPIQFSLIQLEDSEEIMQLAQRAYPANIQGMVLGEISNDFEFLRAGVDNGTKIFKLSGKQKIIGVCGIYKGPFNITPPDVCWGYYFFVEPHVRHSLTAYHMGVELLSWVKNSGFRRMYIETTPPLPDYYNIAPYLERFGFVQEGSLTDYYALGVDKLFYRIDLTTWQPSLRKK